MSFLIRSMLACMLSVSDCNPMDCSPPGSSVHGIFLDRNTGEGCHFLLQGIFLTQGFNLHLLCLLHWQADSLPLSHLEPLFNHRNRSCKQYPFFAYQIGRNQILVIEMGTVSKIMNTWAFTPFGVSVIN